MDTDLANSRIRAVLFDLDGTLVESSLDFDQIRRDIDCPMGQDILQFIAGLDVAAKKRAEACVRDHELQDALSAQVMPGAEQLLSRLSHAQIKTGIITRNSIEATQLKLKRVGMSLNEVITREDAPAKPDPAGLLTLSSQWCLQPEQCVYVGDYLYDLLAAEHAGMHACLYLDSRLSKEPDYALRADFICRHFDIFEQGLTDYLGRLAALKR